MKTSKKIISNLFSLFMLLFLSISLQAQSTDQNLLANVSLNAKKTINTNVSDKNKEEKNYIYDVSAGQVPPQFEQLDVYMAAHLKYPELARENNLEGTVMVLTTISATGKVIEAEIIKSLGDVIDQTALNLVNNMPDWTPGMNYGIPVKSKKILELRFSLQ